MRMRILSWLRTVVVVLAGSACVDSTAPTSSSGWPTCWDGSEYDLVFGCPSKPQPCQWSEGTCPGELLVTTVTTGEGQHPDEFVIAVWVSFTWGSVTFPPEPMGMGHIGVNDTLTIELAPGERKVELMETTRQGLGKLRDNCTVAGDNPRIVTIIQGQRTETVYDVTCVPAAPPRAD